MGTVTVYFRQCEDPGSLVCHGVGQMMMPQPAAAPGGQGWIDD